MSARWLLRWFWSASGAYVTSKRTAPILLNFSVSNWKIRWYKKLHTQCLALTWFCSLLTFHYASLINAAVVLWMKLLITMTYVYFKYSYNDLERTVSTVRIDIDSNLIISNYLEEINMLETVCCSKAHKATFISASCWND